MGSSVHGDNVCSYITFIGEDVFINIAVVGRFLMASSRGKDVAHAISKGNHTASEIVDFFHTTILVSNLKRKTNH